MPSRKLIQAVRATLRELADPAKAPAMQAYMKSEMPYYGVQTPVRRKALKAVFAAHPIENSETWRDSVLVLWRDAKYREERYAAIELAKHRSCDRFRTLAALPMFEEMIVSGAWWDYVDEIASNCIGDLLRRYPSKMTAVLRKWAVSDDIWKRRSAIIAQLRFKADTDLELLHDCIQPSLGRTEFFLREGIGWALRQYAWTDPKEVIRYVRAHEAMFSPLSKREALKNIAQAGKPCGKRCRRAVNL